jgi:outer membrane protein assembly factor BamB
VGGDAGQVNGQACAGTLSALDPDNGTDMWQDCLAARDLAAVTAAPGIVEVNAGNQAMVVDASSGQTLFTYTDPSGNFFWGPAQISNGVLYVINLDGNVFAFVPGPPVGTPEAPLAILVPVAGIAATGGAFVRLRRGKRRKVP